MDCIPKLVFSFDQTAPHDQLISFQQFHTADQLDNSLILKNPVEYGSDLRLPKASNSFSADTPTDNNKRRKILHKEIERQRRQEMSSLYRSLRSLIPLQYLKGKRSISDHMHEAANYIIDLENKIQELNEKRDELTRRLSNSSTSESEYCPQNLIQEDSSVIVRACLAGGVEVVVSTSCRKGLPLSQVFAVLIGAGLIVVNCISTKTNEMLLHNIVSKVNDGRSVDPLELQQKIMKLTSCSSLK